MAWYKTDKLRANTSYIDTDANASCIGMSSHVVFGKRLELAQAVSDEESRSGFKRSKCINVAVLYLWHPAVAQASESRRWAIIRPV